MSQQLGREQPTTADRNCWRDTWGVSPTKWIPMDSCSLQCQILHWNEVSKLVLSHITQKQKVKPLPTWSLLVHSGDVGDDHCSVSSSLTTSLQSIWCGYPEPLLSQTIQFWWENCILFESLEEQHEWLFLARLVLSSVNFVRSLQLTLVALVSFDSLLIHPLSSFSYFHKDSVPWHSLDHPFQDLGTVLAKYFQFSETAPVYQCLSKPALLFREFIS